MSALNKFWHYFFASGKFNQAEWTRLFANAGVETLALDVEDLSKKGGCKSGGIVFFGKTDPSLQKFLLEVSRNGLHRVIAVSVAGKLSATEIWSLLESGATDVLSLYPSIEAAQEITARLNHWESVDRIIESDLVKQNLIGESHIWIKTLRQIINISRFADASILITGESGTGKELVARLIHTLDKKRQKGTLVVLDATTIVPELSGSELFGHEQGAFTGSVSQREGAFSLANKGTLFLDEVGELPLALQAELLRIVQEHTYKRVGGNEWHKTDFRLICATNRNLLEQEERGEFRADFYHRLATWTCHLPALRDRREDIPLLVSHFLEDLYEGKAAPDVDEAVIDYLKRREYPGNVRELFQLVKRITYHHVGNGPLTLGDIPEVDRPYNGCRTTEWHDRSFEECIRRAVLLGTKLKDITSVTEEMAETIAVMAADGKVAKAAENLGIDKRTLHMHRREYKARLKSGSDARPAD